STGVTETGRLEIGTAEGIRESRFYRPPDIESIAAASSSIPRDSGVRASHGQFAEYPGGKLRWRSGFGDADTDGETFASNQLTTGRASPKRGRFVECGAAG